MKKLVDKRLFFLDAFRGWAIMIVIVHHACFIVPSPGGFEYIKIFGGRGVQLFYIISAFTLYYTLDYVYKDDRSWVHFYIRRIFRIAPMYYLGLIFYLMISRGCFEFWFGNQDNLTIGNILSNIFLFHGVSPYWVNGIIPGGWSIAVEMNYYLLFPIIFTYINTIRKASYFTTASLIVYTILHLIMKHIVFVGYSQYYTDYLFYWFPAQLPIFSFGILLYLIYKNKVLNHNNYGSIKAGMMYIIAGIFLIVTLILYYKVHVYGIGVPQHIIYGIAFSFIILGTFYYPIILMVNGFTIYMGKISYSCYILHFPVIYLMSNYKVIDIINGISINIFGNLYKYITFITVSSIIILITLIIASITYKLIEKPLIIFGKRVIRYIIGRKLSRVSILYNQ